jgi:hypothetical protein
MEAYGPNSLVSASGPAGPAVGLIPGPTSWVSSRNQAMAAQKQAFFFFFAFFLFLLTVFQ